MATPLELFEDNIADADLLVDLADALDNFRPYKARRELREKVGPVIKAKKADYDEIDCIESDDFFLVFKPGTDWKREHLQDRGPMLRQAVVAGAAAFESYLADRVIAQIRAIIRANGPLAKNLAAIPMTVQDWSEVESYKYRRRGITEVVIGNHVRLESSTACNKVGLLLSMTGMTNTVKAIDAKRGVAKGTTQSQLDAITARRNKIAHEADRKGRGKAVIEIDGVRQMLANLDDIARAIDALLDAAPLK